MADLESLLNDLANLDAQHDLDGLRRVREQIVEHHPDSNEAAEALYKLGLDSLFRQRDIESAVGQFTLAAKRKVPFWSEAARTSLGLCYFHLKKTQKALFELRRVAYPDVPTHHSVTALTFIETIYTEEKNKAEAEKARKDRIGQLHKLVEATRDPTQSAERGLYLYQLGMALMDGGEKAEARKAFEEAKGLGPDAIGADLFRSVVEQLSG